MSSIWKKVIMGLTGLFLITFLVIHCTINALIFVDDGGKMFGHAAHFMGSNPIIRIMEIGLVLGFLVHIADGLMLWYQNRKARPSRYKVSKASANSPWYSRSMGLLGTLLLMFLILHTADFWIPNRASQFATGEELDLFDKMKIRFSELWVVIVYVAGCVSLFWHLLHGFKSAFQSLGLNHSRYNGIIRITGTLFSIICPFIFAMMPVALHLGWIQ